MVVVLSMLLALFVPPPGQAGGAGTRAVESGHVERRLAAMGTWLEVSVRAGSREEALRASEMAVAAIEATEARLTTWNQTSELARLNRAAVRTEVVLSAELAEDLARATHFSSLTGGAFDPGLGALVEAWGLRTGGRQPSVRELEEACAARLQGFELDGRRAVRRHPLAAFEEGGFGKGIGLDHAIAALVAAGAEEALLDLGGQLAVLGRSVRTTLADPRARERAVLELDCPPGSLATSGNSERGIRVDGVARGHLLDPQSGAPVEDFGSLSVWARDATAADCLSTALYVLGVEDAFRWRLSHPGIELLVLTPGEAGTLRVFASAGWRGALRALAPELEPIFLPDDPDALGALSSSHPLPTRSPVSR